MYLKRHITPTNNIMSLVKFRKSPWENLLSTDLLDFNPNIPVLVVSGQKDVLTAINLMKHGAYDYLVKTDDMIKKLIEVAELLYSKKDSLLDNEIKQ